MTKVLTARVPPPLLEQADRRAARCGLSRAGCVRRLIEADLASEQQARAGRFGSEDLAGRFRLGGGSATDEWTRQHWRQRLERRGETDC